MFYRLICLILFVIPLASFSSSADDAASMINSMMEENQQQTLNEMGLTEEDGLNASSKEEFFEYCNVSDNISNTDEVCPCAAKTFDNQDGFTPTKNDILKSLINCIQTHSSIELDQISE